MIVSEKTQYAGLAAQQEVDYTYYQDGALAIMTTPAGAFGFTYTADGKLLQETTPWASVYNYSYDAAGRLVNKQVDYTNVAYSLNPIGQLTELKNQTVANGQSLTLTDFFGLQYDGAGNLLQESITYYTDPG